MAKLTEDTVEQATLLIFIIIAMVSAINNVLTTLAVAILSQLPAVAQQVTSATVIEILDSDQVFIQNSKAQKNDVAQVGQEVRTGQARAGLRFNNNAGIRLGSNSSLLVGSQCVQLRGGQAVVAGGARGCVGSVVAVTRGTVYRLEVDEIGQGKIQVLEGKVEVYDLENPEIKMGMLSAGQEVIISPTGNVGLIRPIPQGELEGILDGPLIEGFEVPLPGIEQLPGATQSDRSEGFAETFLSEALGGMSDPLGGSAVRSPVSSSAIGEPISTVVDTSTIPGTFTVIKFGGRETIGTFTDSNGSVTNIRVVRTSSQTTIEVTPSITIGNTTLGIDTPATTPLINGVPATDFSFGLSGDDAVVTVVGSDGQIFRARALGIGGKAPPAGATFPGVLSVERGPDR
ncbi:MAG TPA: hypothetical protein DDZ80_23440 [Cyanobacteria bacterium UBA8803]|nr:hypothetical protein [Cyanobacteria bacterium UBA9273]HBL61276.1 hypothetical protein [Cyanobacteria bacterium UBA8803]